MKYRFEGLICLGLFGAGVIWSKLIFPSDFWKVNSIHDLFEIFGAIATVIALSVAVSALSGWKGQFSHTEKYRLIRDFHSACQVTWNGFWYVAHGYDLIEESWKNREVGGWFFTETEHYSTALKESRGLLEAAFSILQHHLNTDEVKRVSDCYWEYMNQVSYGESEVISYTSHCRLMIEEPVGEYEKYFIKRLERLKLIDDARKSLSEAADYLLAKYAQPK